MKKMTKMLVLTIILAVVSITRMTLLSTCVVGCAKSTKTLPVEVVAVQESEASSARQSTPILEGPLNIFLNF